MAIDSERRDGAPDVLVRRARPDEHDDVVALCAEALGWDVASPNAELFRWKHLENPAGPSPTWVAVAGEELVAVRTFLRWRFVDAGGSLVHAVRAVDTATRGDHQGRGLFSRLTLGALPSLRAEGTAFVFNTPNDQSRPGYLKMGWSPLGRVPAAVAVRSPRALGRLARARVPAGKWSLPTSAGRPAEEVLADDAALEALTRSLPAADGLTTHRSAEHLRWRYAQGPVRYRALTAPGGLADGVALFRLRTRGDATEAVLADALVSAGPGVGARRRALVEAVVAAAESDHVLAVVRERRDGPLVAVPRLGPVMTWRSLVWQVRPPMRAFDLSLGDVELF